MLVSKVSVFLFQINLTNHSEKNNNNKIIFMLNKAHSNICVALSNSTCCCFQLFSTQKTSRKVSSNSWKCTFPFLIAKRVGVGKNYHFPKKYHQFPLDYYFSTDINIQKEQKWKKYPHLMKFYLHKFKLLEILRLNSVKLEIFVSRFWTISLVTNY